MDLVKNLSSFIQSYETHLPFSNKKVTFTPFKVKDAKALAIVLQEDNKKIALKNMVDLLRSCTSEIVIEDLCLADAEFLFLQIRSKSVDEMLNLIHNNEKIQINIDEIKFRNSLSKEQILLGNNINLVLETPTVRDLLKIDSFNKEEYRKSFIKQIVINNEIYKVNKFVPEELKNILDNLPLSIVPKLDSFTKKQPELYLKMQLQDGESEVSGLLSFFIFR
jgi:hypothetical protein